MVLSGVSYGYIRFRRTDAIVYRLVTMRVLWGTADAILSSTGFGQWHSQSEAVANMVSLWQKSTLPS